ncbi:MAG: haloacid dehalogenase-like hydrolase [Erysipelotrichaceae bacterium]|nr:haloacid dehalogenase-like hydrolase [Erysipelotrichaceae bacterium]
MTTIAIMYDFDKTLCTKDMQEYGFIPSLNMSPAEFWQNVQMQTKEHNMDSCLSYMYYMVKCANEKGMPITRSQLTSQGKDIELFPGVEDWFTRINAYGWKRGIQIEHYIISSGLKEIIEGSPIAHEFERIYAGEFHYNEDGHADWPAMAVNYTNKTQFMFRINKGALELWDDAINEQVDESDRRIPFTNMIYLGDGMTDVPCMSLVKRYGGHSIAVYQKKKDVCKKLIDQNRINYYAPADYRANHQLETILFNLIDKVALDDKLAEITLAQRKKDAR